MDNSEALFILVRIFLTIEAQGRFRAFKLSKSIVLVSA